MEKTLLVIAGPTASGKTDLSIRLAKYFQTEIVSADSRQCYREMSIGTAKPSPEVLNTIPHYFINSHSIHENLNAADFESLALAYLQDVFSRKDVAILCGGTGLYIKALCDGIDVMPEVDERVEKRIRQSFENNGIAWLQHELKEKDPIFFQQAEQENPVRLIRALTFWECHGKSILDFKSGEKKQRPFRIIKIAVDVPRALLYQRINQRVDAMMQQGLMEEINALYPYRALKNLQTVGYSEFYEQGDFPLSNEQVMLAVEKVKQHSRNYAKRQLTWFRKDKDFHWFPPEHFESILEFLNNKMQLV
ncbi:MAG TPA: tRNA (adenosine(37)-N6)-dimethylallyltransferase MiaA [Edaphocola sp.]|nr:tRNA (adenosine(37)-N6)-dimethylallyltransferase MiaA [Edaphocola sp.]